MPAQLQIVRDTVPEKSGGPRLTTVRASVPRTILAQVQTHGAVLYNTESSRATPVSVMRDRCLAAPFRPGRWLLAGKGMRPTGPMPPEAAAACQHAWDAALLEMAKAHETLESHGAAKEQSNRLLEPWAHVRMVLTGTERGWANFFALRTHPDADETFRDIARALWVLYARSKPEPLYRAALVNWHVPFVAERDYADLSREPTPDTALGVGPTLRECLGWEPFGTVNEERLTVTRHATAAVINLAIRSAARCARVSRGKTIGKLGTFAEDVATFRVLTDDAPVHASPLHHQCYPLEWIDARHREYFRGPLDGWTFLRRFIAGETAKRFFPPEAEKAAWARPVDAGLYDWREDD